MGLKTTTWDYVVGFASALSGSGGKDIERQRLEYFVNSALRFIYDESRYHQRYLVLEPRSVVRGYITAVEDSFNVYGAGTTEANGLYVRNGLVNTKVAYRKYDTDGTTELYSIEWDGVTDWQLLDVNDVVLYSITNASDTPPESAWDVGTGDSLAPVVQALSEINEIISYWNGDRWVGSNPSEVYGYPDQNGFRLTSDVGNVVYVAYKKEIGGLYGNGTAGTLDEFPSEFVDYCARSAAQAYQASNRQADAYQGISNAQVDRYFYQTLEKANRQGAFNTIANIFTTRYSMENSIL